jgi:hypothetical protein
VILGTDDRTLLMCKCESYFRVYPQEFQIVHQYTSCIVSIAQHKDAILVALANGQLDFWDFSLSKKISTLNLCGLHKRMKDQQLQQIEVKDPLVVFLTKSG